MNDDQSYQLALNYVYQFLDFSLTHQEQIAPERFELARMAAFLDRLGNPHHQFKSIHIAGTKGKGSVAAHCAAALQAAGYKTGLYTSPHLHDFRERMQVNAALIPKKTFAELVDSLKPAVEATPGLTSYEIQTAIAFRFFAEQHVDAAVVEVGMGGRLDSTNVITPLVSVITSISYDHTNVLGSTLTEIAGEKGGIVKPTIPVVSSPQNEEALSVLERIAKEKNAPLTLVGREIKYQQLSSDLDGQEFEVTRQGELKRFHTRLLGQHQIENATTAYAALYEASASGLTLDDTDIREGFKQVNWPGRFEVVSNRPAVVFDGAHNRDSAKRLMETVSEYFPGKPVTLVFGAMEDKDIAGMFAEMLPGCAHLILTSAKHPRAAKVEKLQDLAALYECAPGEEVPAEEILPTAVRLAGEQGVVLVTGSLSVVADYRALWFQKSD